MLNLQPKALLIALSFALAACSSNATQPAQSANTFQPRATPTPLPTRAVTASTTVATDGVLILAAPSISLSFDLSGKKVTGVQVIPGQSVKKGDLLATIDDTSLQDAVADAELTLQLLEANLEVQNAPATQEDIHSAQAALNSAYATYKDSTAGSTQSAIDTAKRSVDAAWLSYLNAQSSRDDACGKSLKSNECQSAEASYGNAFESWVAARDNYLKAQEPVSQNTQTQAYASVVTAKSKLDSLSVGETSEQKQLDEAQLAQAKANVERAKADLDQARLVSPCDCVVESVNIAVGATASGAAFSLVNLSDLQFKTTNLTERDVASIKTGAPVSIRLKSYSGTFTGKVAAVLAQSSGTQGTAALFTVLINLDQNDKLLLPGMNGQAEITVG